MRWSLLDDIDYCDGPYSCAENADALVVVTEWEQLRAVDFDSPDAVMARPVLIDLRDYRPEELTRFGFIYHGIGRPSVP